MPARSVVTKENLSADFVVDAGNASGPLRLNLNPSHFSRNSETGLISATGGGGGGGWPGISEQEDNQAELVEDGVFVPPAGPPAISARQGNTITADWDGLYSGAPAISQNPVEVSDRLIVADDANKMIVMGPIHTVEVDTVSSFDEGVEVTLVRLGADFTLTFPAGTTVNGATGPVSFSVPRLPASVVLKNMDGAQDWIMMGNVTEIT